MKFADLGLSEPVLRAVADAGYESPTPIQERGIPYVFMNRDLLGCAQTGTGKTASFTLPMIDILAHGRARARMPRSLIVEPTRELAAQVAENFETYGKHNKLSKALLIGGTSFADQEKAVDRGVDVLIATPGRLLDHVERGKVLLSDVRILVIDEADRMLDMGFMPDVERIVSLLPSNRQTLFYSATMPPEIRRLANKFLSNPKEIAVDPPATAATTVVQGCVTVDPKGKRAALRDLLKRENVTNALIFCNRKRDVGILYRSLKRYGFDAGELHGDMDQFQRTDTLESFKAGNITLLVCSDVAARGLDIQGMSHVFNFDVPTHAEDYVHRIGRTGRAGREGHALMIAVPEDSRHLAAIEKLIGRSIPRIALGGAKVEASTEEKPPTNGERDQEQGAKRRTTRRRRDGRRSEKTAAKKDHVQSGQGRKPKTSEQAKETPVGLGDHVPAFLLRPASTRSD